MKKSVWLLLFVFLNLACSSKLLKYEKSEQLKENKEFDQQVKIIETDSSAESPHSESGHGTATGSAALPPDVTAKTKPSIQSKEMKSQAAKGKKAKTKKANSSVHSLSPSAPAESGKRQPELEGEIGFSGRRPTNDPFRVGEVVIHNVNYLKMTAGTLRFETRPFAEVNGRKNYQFRTTIQTSSVFNSFYSANDYVDVLMDFEKMIPSVFTMHVKESTQLKEAQMFFDQDKNTATYWEKKVTDRDGEENKKQHWEIEPYAQNIFSAAFYMRIFKWEVGKEIAFRVADDNQNMIFRGKALRKERLVTAAGEFDAIVIRPEFELQGKFKPTGDNYIWLSDDDRKFILRIESKIKIGSLVSEVVEIHPGH